MYLLSTAEQVLKEDLWLILGAFLGNLPTSVPNDRTSPCNQDDSCNLKTPRPEIIPQYDFYEVLISFIACYVAIKDG